MKPATVAELGAAIERECMQIPRGLYCDVCNSIASRCQRVWTRMDVNLRTGSDKTIKFVNSITF